MTIRDAKFVDVPRIVALMREQHVLSRYRNTPVQVDEAWSRQFLTQSIMRHGNGQTGGTLVLVSERDGAVEGIFLGILDRILGIGSMLYGTDVFFYLTDKADPRDGLRMIDTFTAWCDANPFVYEIVPGITDTFGPEYPDRVARIYEAKGFERCGTILRRNTRP